MYKSLFQNIPRTMLWQIAVAAAFGLAFSYALAGINAFNTFLNWDRLDHDKQRAMETDERMLHDRLQNMKGLALQSEKLIDKLTRVRETFVDFYKLERNYMQIMHPHRLLGYNVFADASSQSLLARVVPSLAFLVTFFSFCELTFMKRPWYQFFQNVNYDILEWGRVYDEAHAWGVTTIIKDELIAVWIEILREAAYISKLMYTHSSARVSWDKTYLPYLREQAERAYCVCLPVILAEWFTHLKSRGKLIEVARGGLKLPEKSYSLVMEDPGHKALWRFLCSLADFSDEGRFYDGDLKLTNASLKHLNDFFGIFWGPEEFSS